MSGTTWGAQITGSPPLRRNDYAKRNTTIERFQKMLYTATGQAYPDLYSSNFRLKTLFFRRFVIQQAQYVLSNGVTFENQETKKKLGGTFDSQLQKLAKKAMVDGVAYGFWNRDHLEVFGFADTCNEAGFARSTTATTALWRLVCGTGGLRRGRQTVHPV